MSWQIIGHFSSIDLLPTFLRAFSEVTRGVKEMAASEPSAGNITEQLRDWGGGKATEASDAVLNLVYDELHRQAQRYLRRERAGHTLQTTVRSKHL